LTVVGLLLHFSHRKARLNALLSCLQQWCEAGQAAMPVR